MEALVTLAKSFQKLNINEIVNEVIKGDPLLRAQIIDWNTQTQLYEQGVDSEGKSLGQYAAFTVVYKTAIAARLGNDTRADHITLKDTGEFYRSFVIKIPSGKADYFEIDANTIKDGGMDLAIEFGQDILGLTDESLGELGNELRERIVDAIYKRIFK